MQVIAIIVYNLRYLSHDHGMRGRVRTGESWRSRGFCGPTAVMGTGLVCTRMRHWRALQTPGGCVFGRDGGGWGLVQVTLGAGVPVCVSEGARGCPCAALRGRPHRNLAYPDRSPSLRNRGSAVVSEAGNCTAMAHVPRAGAVFPA